MKKAINISILITLLIVSFLVGYTLQVSNSSSSEIKNLHKQISVLQRQNSQIQNMLQQKDNSIKILNSQIMELKSQPKELVPSQKQSFQYTHVDGKNYTISAEEYSYPLNDDAKCSILNKALDLAQDDWSCKCGELKSHSTNWYLDCGIGCVGFKIDEEKKKASSFSICIDF